jgi:prevent-host-death family protein
MASKANPLEALQQLPATEVKKRGWRGVMKAVSPRGKVAITNHNEPEAVILSAEEYLRIMAIVEQAESASNDALEALRQRFDERLAGLQAPDAGDRLRAAMAAPSKNDAKLKAGTGY